LPLLVQAGRLLSKDCRRQRLGQQKDGHQRGHGRGHGDPWGVELVIYRDGEGGLSD
jgi:hypothetical protein